MRIVIISIYRYSPDTFADMEFDFSLNGIHIRERLGKSNMIFEKILDYNRKFRIKNI